MTARVKISQNDTCTVYLPKYLSALKSRTLSNLMCTTCKLVHLQVKMSQPFLTGKSNCLVLLRVVKMTVKTSQNQSKIPLCAHLGQLLATKVQLLYIRRVLMSGSEVQLYLHVHTTTPWRTTLSACGMWPCTVGNIP